MRTGGDILALGRNVERAMARDQGEPARWVEPTLVADQPVTVEHAVDEFMEALWESIAIVLGVSLIAVAYARAPWWPLSIPLVLAAVFVAMDVAGIDLQRISPAPSSSRSGLLVDDAMITVELMVTQLERGDEKEQRGHLRLQLDRLSEADRHAGDHRRRSSRSVSHTAPRANTPSRSSRSSPSR